MIDHANTHWKRMFERGGGVKDLRHKKIYELKTEKELKDVIVVELLINVQESMGMNVSNTVAEGTSDFIQSIIGQGQIGLRITSNLCLERMTAASFKIPIENLAWKDFSGEEVAQGIMNAYNFAVHDVKRTTTHNKGIMNGVDAVWIALGQDWRAIEAASHAYATLQGGYKPLTKYYRMKEDKTGKEFLCGEIELPLSWASKGGVIGTNPSYTATHLIAKKPTGREISSMLCSIGLAQNFAAIRALANEGIQKGHMNLHAKNIAVSAGTPAHLIKEVVEFMRKMNSINKETAERFLKERKIDISKTKLENECETNDPLNTCYVTVAKPDLREWISPNLTIEKSILKKPSESESAPNESEKKLVRLIFGGFSNAICTFLPLSYIYVLKLTYRWSPIVN